MNWRIRQDRREREPGPVPDVTAVHLGTTTFPATEAAVGEARRWLADRLGRDHPAGEDAVLLLSEAFTNGVRYGRGKEIVVSVLARAGGVRVEVVDEGGAGVPHYVTGPCGEGGRGLPIMRALSRTWGFEVVQDGRLKVWFEVSGTSGERLR